MPRFLQKTPFCSWCGQPSSGNRKGSFCSDECEYQWKIRSSHTFMRQCVLDRDGGICALCRGDTLALEQDLARLQASDEGVFRDRCEALGLPDHRVSFWDVDHLIPVKEGGGSCGLENLRTLCYWCHKEIHQRKNSPPPCPLTFEMDL